MLVKDAMTTEPITVELDTPLGTAIAIMRGRGIRHLPVVDDDGRLVGVITDRDLRSALPGSVLASELPAEGGDGRPSPDAELERIPVRQAMSWVVVTTQPEAPLRHAALVMLERRIGSLPVVDGGTLVGILTERDVLRALQGNEPVEEYGEGSCF